MNLLCPPSLLPSPPHINLVSPHNVTLEPYQPIGCEMDSNLLATFQSSIPMNIGPGRIGDLSKVPNIWSHQYTVHSSDH